MKCSEVLQLKQFSFAFCFDWVQDFFCDMNFQSAVLIFIDIES